MCRTHVLRVTSLCPCPYSTYVHIYAFNMNKYKSTKALLQDFVHNTCVKIRVHKSGNLIKKENTNNTVKEKFSQSLQIKQIEKGVANIFLY